MNNKYKNQTVIKKPPLNQRSADVGFSPSSIVCHGITWINSFNFLLLSFLIQRSEIGILVQLIKE